MRTVLESLRQWDVVTGSITAPVPANVSKPTADETTAIQAFSVRCISAFMEISFRIADSAKSILSNVNDPKTAWELLEKRFGAKQQGLQSVLLAKLQLSKWDGSGTIHTHRDNMVDLRTKLADAGMALTDQTFYEYFTTLPPPSLDLFITLYEDPTYNADVLCDRFTKYEMRRMVAATRDGKADATKDTTVALFSQQSSSAPKGEGRDRKSTRLNSSHVD